MCGYMIDIIIFTCTLYRSYLEAVGGHGGKSTVKDDLDLSKPYVPVLESSSQLIDDSFLDESSRMEIDATPLPLRKKARKLKAKSAKARKRSIEAVDKENDQHGVSRKLYMLCSGKLSWKQTFQTRGFGLFISVNFEGSTIHVVYTVFSAHSSSQ